MNLSFNPRFKARPKSTLQGQLKWTKTSVCECDSACFTAQNALTAAGDVSRSADWRVGLLTSEKRAGQTQTSLLSFKSLSCIFLCSCRFALAPPLSVFKHHLPSRYRHTISLGSVAIMCGFCKPPQSLEASKGCADCKSNFCNECFKLYHPWGTPRAQHEHILPTNNFRPKVCLFLCCILDIQELLFYCHCALTLRCPLGPNVSRAWAGETAVVLPQLPKVAVPALQAATPPPWTQGAAYGTGLPGP